nr:hypothetical protein [Deltaproteobacteria bacterium]
MYFVLDCEEPADDDEIPWFEIEHFFKLGGHSWSLGRPMVEEIAEPVAITCERREGYDGSP